MVELWSRGCATRFTGMQPLVDMDWLTTDDGSQNGFVVQYFDNVDLFDPGRVAARDCTVQRFGAGPGAQAGTRVWQTWSARTWARV
jgi:hypothetical protein